MKLILPLVKLLKATKTSTIVIILFTSTLSKPAFAVVNFITSTTDASTNVILWFDANTSPGQGTMAQLRYVISGTTYYTGFISGTYNTSVAGANFKVEIPIVADNITTSGSVPSNATNIWIEGAKCDYNTTNNGFEYTGFAWSLAASPLPVTLVGFTAQASSDEEGIVLTWETSSEINNSHFEIERSADAKDFQKIAVVEGKGTTNELTTYSFIDKSPLNGVNYYRLRQVDLDGKFEFSKIRSVRNETVATNAITFGPNPTEEIISFRGIKKGSKIAVIDMYGKEKFVTTQEDDSLKLQINVEKYSRGLYLVKIYTEGYVEFRKFYVN